MTAPPDNTTTDLHAVIAELRAEREAGLAREARLAEQLAARNTALAKRDSEYSGSIDHQAAIVDVLKASRDRPAILSLCSSSLTAVRGNSAIAQRPDCSNTTEN